MEDMASYANYAIWSVNECGHSSSPTDQLPAASAEGKLLTTIKTDQAPTTCCYDHKGTVVAVGFETGEIRMYNLENSTVRRYDMQKAPITRLQYTKGYNTYLLSGAQDGSCKAYDLNYGIGFDLSGSNTSVNALACNQYDFIVTGCEDGSIKIYPALFDEDDYFYKYDDHNEAAVVDCSFSSNGERLVSASRDANLIIWQCSTNARLTVERLVASNHTDWITGCKWSNSADAILTCSKDASLKVWDANTGEEKHKYVGHSSCISQCAFKYGCALSSSVDGTIKIWSHNGTELSHFGHTQRVICCDMFVSFKPEPLETSNERAKTSWRDIFNKDDVLKVVKDVQKNVVIDEFAVVSVSDDHTIRIWKP
jgi:telomerase protein component 1